MYAESLKSQISSLQHQIALAKKVHEADHRAAREDFERKIELGLKEKNYSVSLQKEKISDLERLISEEKSRFASLFQEFTSLDSEIQGEISGGSEKKRILFEDIQYLTQELYSQKSQIQMLQQELVSLEKDFDQSLHLVSSKFDKDYSAMASQTMRNQGKILDLEGEIEETQRKLKQKDVFSDGDIKTLEEALRSTYHTVELQAYSIEKLRKATEESLKESSQYVKQRLSLEQQEQILLKSNNELKENIDKLERKIYGRSSRKP